MASFDLKKHLGKALDDVLRVRRSTMKPARKSNLSRGKIYNVVAQSMPEKTVIVKAKYEDFNLRFDLNTFSSTKADLLENVTIRLPLKEGSFNIKYKDENGDWVLITSDADLEECIRNNTKRIIRMLILPFYC